MREESKPSEGGTNSKKYVAFVLAVVVLASLATAYYMSITEPNSNEESKQTNRINWSAKNTCTPTPSEETVVPTTTQPIKENYTSVLKEIISDVKKAYIDAVKENKTWKIDVLGNLSKELLNNSRVINSTHMLIGSKLYRYVALHIYLKTPYSRFKVFNQEITLPSNITVTYHK